MTKTVWQAKSLQHTIYGEINIKKIILLILALTLCFALVACGGDATCTEHVDADANGK